jgi:hypothetical protein
MSGSVYEFSVNFLHSGGRIMTTRAEVMARLEDEMEVNNYCGHEFLWQPEQVKDVLFYSYGSDEGYSQYELLVIVSLIEGGFGYLSLWADTTGHGCRCGGMTVVEPTIHGLLSRLTEWEVIGLFAEPVREDVDW